MKIDTRPERLAELLERLTGDKPDVSARRTIEEARATARALCKLEPICIASPVSAPVVKFYALGEVEVDDGDA